MSSFEQLQSLDQERISMVQHWLTNTFEELEAYYEYAAYLENKLDALETYLLRLGLALPDALSTSSDDDSDGLPFDT